MNNKTKRIELTDYQKREILKVFENKIQKSNIKSEVMQEIENKLKEFMPQCTENDVLTIFNDCKMYVLIKNLYSISQRQDFSGLSIKKETAMYKAKNYILNQYLRMSDEELEEREIIDDIVNEMKELEFSEIEDKDIARDIVTFLQSKLEIKTDISLEEAEELFSSDGRYRLFLRFYVENLLKTGRNEIPKEQIIREQREDGIPDEKIKRYLARLEKKNRIRRNVLVLDSKAEKLLKSEQFAIEMAEEYLYNDDGTRKIENSLVEDKLLTIYLETGRYDAFEEIALEKMYDKKTGKYIPGQERTASKYIKALCRFQGRNQEALDFIRKNIEYFKSDILIINQWYNICFHTKKDHGKQIGDVYEIIQAITSNVVLDDSTGKYEVQGFNNSCFNKYNLKLMDSLISEMNNIKKDAKGVKAIELNTVYNKLFIIKRFITNNMKGKKDQIQR